MKRIALLILLTASVSGCAAGTSAPVRSQCFDNSGRPTCSFKPLPELWQEARASANV